MGELSLDYSQIASLKEHCAQNSRFQELTTNIVDDEKKMEGPRQKK